MDGSAVVTGVVAVLFGLAVLVHSQRTATARTPRGIMRRLKFPGDQVTVSATGVFGNPGIWNPSKPLGQNNLIYQPGVATYTLDDEAQVHLDWWSRSGGAHQHYVGPPLPLPHPSHDGSTRIMLWVVLGGGLGGLGIGYLFSVVGEVGPHPDVRVLAGMGGLAVGLTVLFCVEQFLVRRHQREG